MHDICRGRRVAYIIPFLSLLNIANVPVLCVCSFSLELLRVGGFKHDAYLFNQQTSRFSDSCQVKIVAYLYILRGHRLVYPLPQGWSKSPNLSTSPPLLNIKPEQNSHSILASPKPGPNTVRIVFQTSARCSSETYTIWEDKEKLLITEVELDPHEKRPSITPGGSGKNIPLGPACDMFFYEVFSQLFDSYVPKKVIGNCLTRYVESCRLIRCFVSRLLPHSEFPICSSPLSVMIDKLKAENFPGNEIGRRFPGRNNFIEGHTAIQPNESKQRPILTTKSHEFCTTQQGIRKVCST